MGRSRKRKRSLLRSELLAKVKDFEWEIKSHHSRNERADKNLSKRRRSSRSYASRKSRTARHKSPPEAKSDKSRKRSASNQPSSSSSGSSSDFSSSGESSESGASRSSDESGSSRDFPKCKRSRTKDGEVVTDSAAIELLGEVPTKEGPYNPDLHTAFAERRT
ncbi:RNA-binding protein with serine-rich domain 1-like [Diachasma alloeum]|uniref:RNA-binding protein with serine-rich domain 1-like n=1 Tax=Diachasma alloeum TaxID=454923 RepID=UPI000738298B|nr:RNA-binding protein with serine-rich domain 1-like [Diachasma alloeum]